MRKTLQNYNAQNITKVQCAKHYKSAMRKTLQNYNAQNITKLQCAKHYKITMRKTLQNYNAQNIKMFGNWQNGYSNRIKFMII